MSAGELDQLGESLFWLDRPDDSITVLGRAFTAHLADDDHAGAAMASWQLFYDHALVGEMALANGRLERARREAAHVEGSAAAGFLAVAESDRAAGAGAIEDAVTHAERALALGHTTGHADLTAMALQAKGRALVACGRLDDGINALDEAMVGVVNGELTPLFAGWVYCNALSACHDLADLNRAIEWTESAMRWCNGLREGRLYPGICRLHVVELATLRGTWETAAVMAQQACEELTSHDPRYAGEAHYLIGELHRMAGDLDLGEEAFTRAHQLGRVPQPGLARVRLAQGRLDAAVKPAYRPLVELAARHAGPEAVAILSAYWACGDLDELLDTTRAAGLEVLSARTRMGIARFDSIDEFVSIEVESTPVREHLTDHQYDTLRSEANSVLKEFTAADGTAVIPIEGHLVAARRG